MTTIVVVRRQRVNVQLVGAELFQVGRETNRRADRNDEANNRLSQFCELA